jgi:hypothetical protein
VSPAAGQQLELQPSATRSAAAVPLTRQERTTLLDELVNRWAAHVQVTHGQDPEIWRERLQSWAQRLNDDNLRRALAQDSYDAAMAALVGRTAHADTPAAVAAPGDADDPQTIAARLGDLTADLTYTPLTPCRIVDTRSTGLGAISANNVRSVVALTVSNFSSQGGSPTACGTSGMSATAVAINVTAVAPAAAGYTTVFPWNYPPVRPREDYRLSAGSLQLTGQCLRDVSIYGLALAYARPRKIVCRSPLRSRERAISLRAAKPTSASRFSKTDDPVADQTASRPPGFNARRIRINPRRS